MYSELHSTDGKGSSFVSSFFGMNVTDIRNMETSQTLFWSTALPVTLGVLAIAYLYGYKWDSVVGRLERLVDDFRENRAAKAAAAERPVAEPALPQRTATFGPPQSDREETEKRAQWSWMQDAVDGLQNRHRRPKRRPTNKTIGE